MKLYLPFLETMITQVCNLACEGCTNYSDLRHSGYVTWNEGKRCLTKWNQRIEIADFGIIGGEPLINPEVRQWLIGVREVLPSAQIRFTTNGLLLPRYPDILDLCQEIGNVVFKITAHTQDESLENFIQQLMHQKKWTPITEHGIKRWRTDRGLRLQINRPRYFVPPFRNTYRQMAPWNSDPNNAFARCIQQTCPLLYKDRIYKCSTSALLADTLDRFDRPNWDQWQSYLTPGIGVDDNEDVIAKFVNFFGKPESICAQCPDHDAPYIDHTTTVRLQKNK